MDAHRLGFTIRVYCPYDKRERYFLPEEMKVLFGDVECDDLRFMLKCSQCGGRVDVKTENLSAEEKQKGVMRRLVKVYYVRRAMWRDEAP
jgi:hypothetical protein